MKDEIRLFEYLNCKIDKIVSLYHKHWENQAAEETKNIILEFEQWAERIYRILEQMEEAGKPVSYSFFIEALEQILDAQKNLDNILIADLLEKKLKDFFCQVLQILIEEQWHLRQSYMDGNKKVLNQYHVKLLHQVEAAEPLRCTEYILEPCNNGAVTLHLKENESSYYMCSNVNPQKAARELAAYYCERDAEKYYLWGFGFGYEAEAILEEDPYTELCVIETDPYIIKLALESRDLTELFSNPRFTLKLHGDKAPLETLHGEERRLFVNAPSIRHIQNKELREALENYYIHFVSVKENENLLYDNFKHNINLGIPNITQLRERFRNKQMIYVGGGPSLDKVMPCLKTLKNNYIVVCAGTVAGKLMRAGIKPEYSILIDGSTLVERQVDGNIDANVTSMLYLSTAAKKAVKAFEGKRYLIYQYGFLPAETAAKEEGAMLFGTGGSVSTTALDVGLRFGCSKILCMGLDLAYTGSKSHASDTLAVRNVSQSEEKRVVECVTGGTVKAANNLDIYRKWIEQRIRNEKHTEMVNVSDGAIIHGMKNISCDEFLRQNMEE